MTGRKKFKKALIALSALFGCAAHQELTGYAVFDREDGTNMICDIDPACRYLTDNERDLAYGIFGDDIDYSTVKIYNRPNYVTTPLKRLFGFNGVAESPNGNIYVKKEELKSDDMTKAPDTSLSFLHEMTHVWQTQSGRNLFAEAVWEYRRTGGHFEKAYDYDMTVDVTFADLKLEQQPELIEDYYAARQEYTVFPSSFNRETLANYTNAIGDTLPLPNNTLAPPVPAKG